MDKVLEHHGTTTGRWSSDPGRSTHTVYPKMVMVVVGTLGVGLTFYGPFKDGMAAHAWAGDNLIVGTTVRIERLNLVKEEK